MHLIDFFTAMKIATWNVNSLRVRLPHVLEWLRENPVDVLALQETKLEDDKFPLDEMRAAGFEAAFSGQKTYNGVALLSRVQPEEVVRELPDMEDEQRRFLAATVDGVRIVCVYVPNGQTVESDKYRYKLEWLTRLRDYLTEELNRFPCLAVVGDFNIAPADADVHDPAAWEGQVLCSAPEREALQALFNVGLVDSFRRFDQPPGQYSWWDYRAAAFRRNAGLRIDHVLASNALGSRCTQCHIDVTPRRWERPSDHAPVIAEFTRA